MCFQVAIPESVARHTSSSVSAFQIGPCCVWLLFFGGLLGYLKDKDERHQPMMARTELLELSKTWAELYHGLLAVSMETFTLPLYNITTNFGL